MLTGKCIPMWGYHGKCHSSALRAWTNEVSPPVPPKADFFENDEI
jgi:hypothetical protein